MRVFIQTKEQGKFHNDNFFKAYLGFHEMGFETITFSNNKELQESNLEDVVVGYVGTVRSSDIFLSDTHGQTYCKPPNKHGIVLIVVFTCKYCIINSRLRVLLFLFFWF